MLTVPNRVIRQEMSYDGVKSKIQLVQVRDELEKINRAQQPLDFERPLNELTVRFEQGVMWAQWKGENYRMRVSENGAQQMAKHVLPARFFSGLKQTALRGPKGAELASELWAEWARTASQTVRARAVRIKLANGEVVPMIRAITSLDYAPYANLELLTDIVEHATEFASLPVLQWTLTDEGLRVRFAGVEPVLDAIGGLMPEVWQGAVIPMIELWNSEVGRRRVGLHGGAWKTKDQTGFGTWEEEEEYAWVHRGSVSKIRTEFNDAFETTRVLAQNVVEAYNVAVSIPVKKPAAWFGQQLRPYLSQKQLDAYLAQIPEKDVVHLSDLVDILLQEAKGQKDMFEQREVERLAAKLLYRGNNLSVKLGGAIE